MSKASPYFPTKSIISDAPSLRPPISNHEKRVLAQLEPHNIGSFWMSARPIHPSSAVHPPRNWDMPPCNSVVPCTVLFHGMAGILLITGPLAHALCASSDTRIKHPHLLSLRANRTLSVWWWREMCLLRAAADRQRRKRPSATRCQRPSSTCFATIAPQVQLCSVCT